MHIIITFLKHVQEIKHILSAIRHARGRPYLVGGSVRDLLLGREVKDFDVEVHGISVDELENSLKKFGAVSLVGKQFGVLKLHNFSLDIDWSLPRKDSRGRKPTVIVDPCMTIEQACRRRDLTINAMAIDLGFVLDHFEEIFAKAEKEKTFDCAKNMQIIDPYGGLEDLGKGCLRAVDTKLFVEDPLRFYRVMQFVGRFEMWPDEVLHDICKKMDLRDVTKGGELARERIYEEIKKLILKSKKPSLGWRWLKELGRLSELFPEIGALIGVEQREVYHPEGDVFEHTMQSLDAAAGLEIGEEACADEREKFTIMLGVLCHDLGKVEKTDHDGHSKGHDVAGVPLTKSFLKRFTRDSLLIRSVCKLVRYHRMPLMLVEQKSSLKAYKRLAIKLAPEITFRQLYWVSWSDIRGRNAEGSEPLKKGFGNGDAVLKRFLQEVCMAQIDKGPEQPVLQGRDLLDVVEPGPEMGRLLREAYKIQIEEGIKDKDVLKRSVLGDK